MAPRSVLHWNELNAFHITIAFRAVVNNISLIFIRKVVGEPKYLLCEYLAIALL